ncbi:MAG TPA: serine/threonine-protein kinase [Rhodanobacteraceae bacterium]|nr:serine/threonine-protein kinase [Rhodanobacteraceae bacterium]
MTGHNLDPQRWQRLTELFDQALELDAVGRRRLLDDTRDEDLRAELQRLLAADAASGPLDTRDGAVMRARMDQALNAPANDDAWLGERIGAWRIERLLASGGMGRVFLAARDDGEFEQQAALKLLSARWADDLTRRRFLEERRVLAKLAHPNIARLLDGGLGPQGEPWYAMEYVDGAPLTDWCDARELPIAARLDLFRKVCEAVDFAHRHLVIHRDLKPGNIMVDAEGEPKLLDFGIAKLLPAQNAQMHSDTRLMTPEYAAPEQLRGEPVSTATDVYALGAVLFELLTGRRAFADPLAPREAPSLLRACPTSDPAIATRAGARATTSRNLRKSLRGDLERILRAALDPDPARRYRGPLALTADLRRHLRGHPISLRRDRGYRLGKFARRHRMGVAIGTSAIFAILAVSVYAVRQADVARSQAQRAEAVRDFMVSVFASADPGAHPGEGPRARELLDAGARAMHRQFHTDAEAEVALSRALAKSYSGIGAYGPARALAQAALDATLKLHGADSPEALTTRNDYAEILQVSGSEQEALEQAQRVLSRARDTTLQVRAHLVMASAESQLLHEQQAEQEARRALTLAQPLGARGERWQAAAWNDLAQSYLGRGQFAAAQQALRQATMLYTRSLGADNPQSMDARTNLIFLLLHSGHANEAMSMYAGLIAEQRRTLGPQSPALAQTLSEYAYMLWSAGDYAQARDIAGEAQIALAAAADMSPMLHADSEQSLAILLRNRGDVAGALRILDEIERTDASPGKDGERMAFARHWLRAAIAAERGEPNALAQLDALRALGQKIGYAMEFPAKLDWPLAWLAAGQPQRALQSYEELAALPSTSFMQAAHRNTLLLGRGVALVQIGRYPEASQVLDQAAVALAGKPDKLVDAITVKLWQGWLRARRGQPQAGIADIESALNWRQQQLGDESYLTAEARLALAETLSKLGRHDEALIEQAQARAVLVAQLAPQHALRRRAELPLPR